MSKTVMTFASSPKMSLIPSKSLSVEAFSTKRKTPSLNSLFAKVDTSKFKDYGKFARLKIKGLKAGARINLGEKKNKTDFALWKFSPKDKKRQMERDSPR